MGRRLDISFEAIHDLDDIWSYIAADSLRNADSFIDRLYEKCKDLTKLDGVGRKRNDLLKNMLSIPYGQFVIFFMRSKHEIEIVRILRGSRDIESIFSS